MLQIEWKHYMVRCGLWLLLPIFVICKLLSLSFETVYIDTHVTDAAYEDFFEQYGGFFDLEKKNAISQMETDETMQRYISYADDNPAKHYIIEQTGWEAWIGNEKLEIILIAFVIFFIAFITTYDYETGVEAVKFGSYRRRKDIYFSWQIMSILFLVCLLFISFGCEWLYYTLKYGLHGYDYPIQSLWSYENSSLDLSIFQTCLMVHMIKGVGLLLVAEITCLFGRLCKNLWRTVLISGAISVVPYMLFNKEQIRYYILPLNLLLGNGYLRGESTEIMYDGVQISEPVGNIPVYFLMLTLSVAGLIIIAIQNVLLCGGRSIKKERIYRYGAITGISVVAYITAICIVIAASKPEKESFTQSYYDGKTFCDELIIRDVFSPKDADGYYADDNCHYYYIKNETGTVYFYKIGKDDYSSEIIYSEDRGEKKYDYSTRYLGLVNVQNYENKSYESSLMDEITYFWVDGKYIFIADLNDIEMINYESGEKEILVEEGYAGGAVAYDSGRLYYISSTGTVNIVDVENLHVEAVGIEGCAKLGICDGYLVYMLTDGSVGIYSDDMKALLEDVTMNQTSNFSCNGLEIFFISSKYKLCCYDLDTKNVSEITCYDEAGEEISAPFYNVKAYDRDRLEVYIQTSDEAYEWVTCFRQDI